MLQKWHFSKFLSIYHCIFAWLRCIEFGSTLSGGGAETTSVEHWSTETTHAKHTRNAITRRNPKTPKSETLGFSVSGFNRRQWQWFRDWRRGFDLWRRLCLGLLVIVLRSPLRRSFSADLSIPRSAHGPQISPFPWSLLQLRCVFLLALALFALLRFLIR